MLVRILTVSLIYWVILPSFSSSGLNVTSGITPYTGSSFAFLGQFGTVTSNGSSTQAEASTFLVEMTFVVNDIRTNINGKIIQFTSKVFHGPGYRNYVSDLNFKVST